MKRFLILLLLLFVCTEASAASKAQSINFLLSQVRTSTTSLVGGSVYFYAAGTSTPQTVWLDRGKITPASNPYTLDSNGTAQLYGDGIYRVVIKDSGGATKFDRDNLSFVDYLTSGTYQAVDSDYASLNAAVAAIGSTPTTLTIKTANYPMTGPVSIPATMALNLVAPGSVNQGSYALTINGPVATGNYQSFVGSGTVTGLIGEARPEWFGVSGTNDDVAINKAIASLSSGDIVLSKTYYIDTNPVNMKSGVSLRGLGRADFLNGSRGPILYNRRSSGACVFIGEGVSNINIENIGFATAATTVGQYGIEMAGRSALQGGVSSFNVNIEKNSFYRLDMSIYAHATSADMAWQMDHVSVKQNTMNEVNVGIKLDSFNCSYWDIENNGIFFKQKGIWLRRAGLTTLQVNAGGAPDGLGGVFAGSVFIESYLDESTSILGNQAEQLESFYVMNYVSGHVNPVVMQGNIANAPVRVDGPIILISSGNLFSHNFTFTAGDSVITSHQDVFTSPYDFVMTGTNTRITEMTRGTKVKYQITSSDNQSLAKATNAPITTTADTKIASLVPPDLSGTQSLMYRVSTSILSTGSTNIRLHLKWKDGIGIVNDQDILPTTAITTGSKFVPTYSVLAIGTGATAIEVWAIASVANLAYVSAEISPLTY